MGYKDPNRFPPKTGRFTQAMLSPDHKSRSMEFSWSCMTHLRWGITILARASRWSGERHHTKSRWLLVLSISQQAHRTIKTPDNQTPLPIFNKIQKLDTLNIRLPQYKNFLGKFKKLDPPKTVEMPTWQMIFWQFSIFAILYVLKLIFLCDNFCSLSEISLFEPTFGPSCRKVVLGRILQGKSKK